MLKFLTKTATGFRAPGTILRVHRTLFVYSFVLLSLALFAFPSHSAIAQETEPFPGELNYGYGLVFAVVDSVDFVLIDTTGKLREWIYRLAGRDDTTTAPGGGGFDTLKVISVNRHDWHIYGKKVFHALVRADSIHIGINDSSLQYGAFAVRTSDTARTGISVRIVDNGTRGTFLRIYNDGIVDLPNNSAARAYMSSAQNTTASTDTQLDFDSESYDNREEFSLTNDSFHATKTGLYLVQGQVNVSSGSAMENCVAIIYKNGSAFANGVVSRTSNNGFNHWATSTVSTVMHLSAGDVVDLRMFTPSVAAIELGQGISWFEVVKMQ